MLDTKISSCLELRKQNTSLPPPGHLFENSTLWILPQTRDSTQLLIHYTLLQSLIQAVGNEELIEKDTSINWRNKNNCRLIYLINKQIHFLLIHFEYSFGYLLWNQENCKYTIIWNVMFQCNYVTRET